MPYMSRSKLTVWGSGPEYTYQEFIDWGRKEQGSGYYGALYWARASRIGLPAGEMAEEEHFEFNPNAPELEEFIADEEDEDIPEEDADHWRNEGVSEEADEEPAEHRFPTPPRWSPTAAPRPRRAARAPPRRCCRAGC